ncbi:substance-K receptor-like [Clytia hemisphaerica]|uniref:substance-K receptor-like n=1 Tax=Clytia hemisphaerica TaxID=252671 RepID=UPI0034D422E8
MVTSEPSDPNKVLDPECNNNLLFVIIDISITAIGLIANAIVVLISSKYWALSTLCQKLIAFLALADMLCSFVHFIHLFPQLWTCSFLYGYVGCMLVSLVVTSSSQISLSVILVIAIERFMGIVYPFSRGLSTKKAYVITLLLSFCGILITVPSCSKIKITKSIVNGNSCSNNWTGPESVIYFWIILIGTFVIPVIVLCVLYTIILKVLSKASQEHHIDQSMRHQTTQRTKSNRRVMKILIVLLTAFVVCVLPNKIYWLLKTYGLMKKLLKQDQDVVRFTSNVFYSIHLSINPFIYAVVDSRFRNRFKFFVCGLNRR